MNKKQIVLNKKDKKIGVLFSLAIVSLVALVLILNKYSNLSKPTNIATKNSTAITAKTETDITEPQKITRIAKSSNVKGIYLTQWTLENTSLLNYLIKHAKRVGIDTFVIDMEIPSKRYRENVALVKENKIAYVARIIMFPDGGTPPTNYHPRNLAT